MTQLWLFVQLLSQNKFDRYQIHLAGKSRKADIHDVLICMHTHAAFIFINIFGVCVRVRQSPQEDSFISSLKADTSILHHLFTLPFLSFRRVGQPSISSSSSSPSYLSICRSQTNTHAHQSLSFEDKTIFILLPSFYIKVLTSFLVIEHI